MALNLSLEADGPSASGPGPHPGLASLSQVRSGPDRNAPTAEGTAMRPDWAPVSDCQCTVASSRCVLEARGSAGPLTDSAAPLTPRCDSELVNGRSIVGAPSQVQFNAHQARRRVTGVHRPGLTVTVRTFRT